MRIVKKPIPDVDARPLESNILEWHFVLHGTHGAYEGGKCVRALLCCLMYCVFGRVCSAWVHACAILL